MSERWWSVVCLLALLTGGLAGVTIGGAARERAIDHRYIRALAERHEAEGSYWINKLNDEIQESRGDIARGRKNDGQKKN